MNYGIGYTLMFSLYNVYDTLLENIDKETKRIDQLDKQVNYQIEKFKILKFDNYVCFDFPFVKAKLNA